MARTRQAGDTSATDDADLDTLIEQDPNEPGRHNARFVDYGRHVWAVLNTLRRDDTDIAQAAVEWGMPEEMIRAALRYYERHRDLYDAYFLLQDEEYNADAG